MGGIARDQSTASDAMSGALGARKGSHGLLMEAIYHGIVCGVARGVAARGQGQWCHG